MHVFMHIQKTGGLTLDSVIRTHLEPEHSVFITDPIELSIMPDTELNRFDYISTHVGHIVFDRITVPHTRITILRHPIERVLSWYHYQRQLHAGHSHLPSAAKTQSIAAYVDSTDPATTAAIDNAMTWQLFSSSHLFFRIKHKAVPETELLGRALEHLRGFDFVGVTEEFEMTVEKMRRRFGWPALRYTDRNRNRTRPVAGDHDRATLRRIADRVRLDMRVYQEARTLLSRY